VGLEAAVEKRVLCVGGGFDMDNDIPTKFFDKDLTQLTWQGFS